MSMLSVDAQKYEQSKRNRGRTVAIAMTKVALLEHCTISSSSWMIFLIRETGSRVNSSSLFSFQVVQSRTRQGTLAGDLILLAGVLGRHDGDNLEVHKL